MENLQLCFSKAQGDPQDLPWSWDRRGSLGCVPSLLPGCLCQGHWRCSWQFLSLEIPQVSAQPFAQPTLPISQAREGLLSAGGALAMSRLRAELIQHLLYLIAPLASFKLIVSFPKETLDIN